MGVYVDEAKYPYRGMIMCHMFADTAEELHAMADKIGVARKWYQVADGPHRASFPHYDIAKSKRQKAVSFGAEELNDRRAGWLKRKEIRAQINSNPEPWRYASGQTKDTTP